MRFSQAFPSKYLKAADLDGDEPVVTIAKVSMEKVGEDERPVLYFKEEINGSEKGLVLNKTNGSKIANATGLDDMRKWVGVKIKLFEDEVEFNGQMRPTIKVRLNKQQPKADSQDPEPPAKSGSQKYQDKELDDEIPF